jgi:2-octaprenyl-6-methoxyphenol hydroxylase
MDKRSTARQEGAMRADLEADILVAGGGHAGLLVATALALRGWRVRVVDPAPTSVIREEGPTGRTLALLAGSRAIGERLGVWEAVGAAAAPIWRTEVTDVSSGARVVYSAREELGEPFGYGLENHVLRQALLEAFLAAAGDEALLQGQVVALGRGARARHAVLEDGRRVACALVVGADGRSSKVRELARITVDRWAYDQAALAFVVEHERAHGDAVREQLRPGGPLALLPLPGRRSGVTWVEPHGRAEELARAGPDALAGELGRLFADAIGPCRVVGPIGRWPLSAQHARRYVAPGLALIGDAAHGVHPIHAQGFNMAVGDVGRLCEALDRARRLRLDPGSGEVLVPYERDRRAANRRRIWLTDGLNRLFSNEIGPLAAARGLGLSLLDRMPPLKRAAIKEGMRAG